MRPVALVMMFCLMSCSGTCEQGCAPVFAEDPRPWRRVAASATEADIGWVDQHLLRVPADRRELVEQVLDRMAMAGTGPSALTRAGEIAAQDQNVANDPMWDGSGMAPGSAAIFRLGTTVLAGMAFQSARSRPEDATELVRAICSMRMPVLANSGGPVDTSLQRAGIVLTVERGVPEGAPAPVGGYRCPERPAPSGL